MVDPLFPTLRAVGDRVKGDVAIGNRPLSKEAYRAVLKKRCEQIGLDPAEIGGHSLRAGHATQAAANGAGVLEIAHGGRWRHLQTVQAYVRFGARFNGSSSARLGL